MWQYWWSGRNISEQFEGEFFVVKKKRRLIFIILVIIFILVGLLLWHKHEEKKEQTDITFEILMYEKGKTDGNMCIITDFRTGRGIYDDIMKDGYIPLRHSKYMPGIPGGVAHFDYMIVDIYDVDKKEIVRTIDLTKELNDRIGKGVIVSDESGRKFRNENGDLCLSFKFYETSGEPYYSVKSDWKERLHVNLCTGEIEIETDVTEEVVTDEELAERRKQRNKYLMTEQLFYQDEIGLLEANGLQGENHLQDNGFNICKGIVDSGITITVRVETLPKKNQRLYSEFPELKEYEGATDDLVTIVLEDYSGAEDILSLLMEDGQEISYEGCVLPAELSVDGQSHDIHSFEEYVQWRKQEE